MNAYECMYKYGNYAFHLEHFSGDVSLLGVGLHFKFLAALAPGEWLFSDSGFNFLIQVSQNHLTPNSDFSQDFAHIFGNPEKYKILVHIQFFFLKLSRFLGGNSAEILNRGGGHVPPFPR